MPRSPQDTGSPFERATCSRRAERLSSDTKKLFLSQALRAFAYGFGALLLGTTLHSRGASPTEVGILLGAVAGGGVLVTVAVARFADRAGRRRCYMLLYITLAGAGAAFAFTDALWILVLISLTGTLSADNVDSGPFTSLEQAMLGTALEGQSRIRAFSLYNSVAGIFGSIGALGVAGPSLLRSATAHAPTDQRYFLVFVPVGFAGAWLARSLSERVEFPRPEVGGKAAGRPAPVGLGRSKGAVVRLSALFAVDSFAGGFVLPAFITYWLAAKYSAPATSLGLIFFVLGLLQTVSYLVAARLAERFGLLRTMVFSHLPAHAFVIAVAFAPNLWIAGVLLFARALLSKMDVPTRQAYVMELVDPAERTAAAGYTNAARFTVRPLAPVLAGASQGIAFGLPFVIAGVVKTGYDLALWGWFRRVPLPGDDDKAAPGTTLNS